METLRAIVTVFMRPLRTWATEEGDGAAAARSGGVTTDEISILFGLVDTLLEVNSGMLEQLKQGEATPEPARLAMTMATWAAGPLRMYSPHVSRFPAVCALLARLLDRRVRFKAAVRVLELQPAAKGLTLQALLVNTVQRLPRYTLLLKEMLTHSTAETLGHSVNAVRDKLHLALGKIKDVTVGVDRSVGDTERRKRSLTICREILRRDDLVEASRTLLREGALTKLRRPRGWTSEARPHASRREGFLFSDMLIIHAPDTDGTRILPLSALVLITAEIVRCHTFSGPRTLPYDSDPRNQRRSALQPAIAALGLEPSALTGPELENVFVVATAGAGNQLLLRASSAAERREWENALVEASEICMSRQAAGDVAGGDGEGGDGEETTAMGERRSSANMDRTNEFENLLPSFGRSQSHSVADPTAAAASPAGAPPLSPRRSSLFGSLLSPRGQPSGDESSSPRASASPRASVSDSSASAGGSRTPRSTDVPTGPYEILLRICHAMEDRAHSDSERLLSRRRRSAPPPAWVTSSVVGASERDSQGGGLSPERRVSSSSSLFSRTSHGDASDGGSASAGPPANMRQASRDASNEEVDTFIRFTGVDKETATAYVRDGLQRGHAIPDIIGQYFDSTADAPHRETDEYSQMETEELLERAASGASNKPNPPGDAAAASQRLSNGNESGSEPEGDGDGDGVDLARENSSGEQTASMFAAVAGMDKATAIDHVKRYKGAGLSSLEAMLETFFEGVNDKGDATAEASLASSTGYEASAASSAESSIPPDITDPRGRTLSSASRRFGPPDISDPAEPLRMAVLRSAANVPSGPSGHVSSAGDSTDYIDSLLETMTPGPSEDRPGAVGASAAAEQRVVSVVGTGPAVPLLASSLPTAAEVHRPGANSEPLRSPRRGIFSKLTSRNR